jgi:hypothetical protein
MLVFSAAADESRGFLGLGALGAGVELFSSSTPWAGGGAIAGGRASSSSSRTLYFTIPYCFKLPSPSRHGQGPTNDIAWAGQA